MINLILTEEETLALVSGINILIPILQEDKNVYSRATLTQLRRIHEQVTAKERKRWEDSYEALKKEQDNG